MNIQEFFDRVCPPGAPQQFPTEANGKWQERHLTQDPIATVQQLSAAGSNCFYAPASYKINAVLVGEGRTGQVARKTPNVAQLKALWLDIDVHNANAIKARGNDAYDDMNAAIEALRDFCKTTKIKSPTILLNSGGGIHVYWTLTQAIPVERWQFLATALRLAAEGARFKIDGPVTVNPNGVLRVIDTLNYKYEPPQRVTKIGNLTYDYTPEQMEEMLAPWTGLGFGGKAGAADNTALGGGMTREYEDMFMEPITQKCPIFKEALETGGKELGYHEWKNTLHVAAYAKDGLDWIAALSSGHPGYNASITREKYDQSVQSKSEGIKPTICTTMAGLSDRFNKHCESCPFNGQVTSPLHLGTFLPRIPAGFFRDGGRIYATAKDDKEAQKVFDCDVLAVQLRRDDEGTYVIDLDIERPNKSKSIITFPIQVLNGSINTTGDYAGRHGLAVHAGARKKLQELLVSWVQQLQNAKQDFNTTPPIHGWGKGTSFSYAGMAYANGRGKKNSMLLDDFARTYQATGDLGPWRDAATFLLEDGRPETAALIASAFAAPLVSLAGYSGMTMSVISDETGVGKSSAMQVAQAVWGHPVSGMQSLTDTVNAVAKKMGQLRNLPVYWDELRLHSDVKQMVQFMFQLGQGKEKSRLNKQANARDVATWSTLLTVGSNISLMNYMRGHTQDTDAGVARIFEFTMPALPDPGRAVTATYMLNKLQTNYGCAGEAYAKYLSVHKEKLTNILRTTTEQLVSELGYRPEERFWVALMAALLVGASNAKLCGLVDFDVRGLRRFLIVKLKEMRGVIVTHNQGRSDVLSEYLNGTAGNRLVTDVFSVNHVKVIPLHRPRLDVVHTHFSAKERKVRVSLTGLAEWCKRNGRERPAIEQTFLKNYSSKSLRTVLAAGTEFATGGRIRCLEFDLTGPEFDDLFATWAVTFSDDPASHGPGS